METFSLTSTGEGEDEPLPVTNQEEKELVHNVDMKNLSNFEKYIVGKIEPEKLFELYKEDYLNQGSLF